MDPPGLQSMAVNPKDPETARHMYIRLQIQLKVRSLINQQTQQIQQNVKKVKSSRADTQRCVAQQHMRTHEQQQWSNGGDPSPAMQVSGGLAGYPPAPLRVDVIPDTRSEELVGYPPTPSNLMTQELHQPVIAVEQGSTETLAAMTPPIAPRAPAAPAPKSRGAPSSTSSKPKLQQTVLPFFKMKPKDISPSDSGSTVLPSVEPAARKAQLKQIWREKVVTGVSANMVESKKLTRYKAETKFCLRPDEEMKLQQMHTKWDNRPPCFRKDCTAEYQNSKYWRIELLAISSQVEREEEFDRRCNYFGWSAGTASGYWSQMIKVAEQLGEPVTVEMRCKSKILNTIAAEELPGRQTVPLMLHELLLACELLPQALALALMLAFYLGTRMGDTMKLETGCLESVRDRSTDFVFLAIQYLRGKTTRRTQPFSLHIPETMTLAQRLIQLQEQQLALPSDGNQVPRPLFINNREDADQALEQIRGALRQVNPELGLLSVRRGGLQLMAQNGASTATLMHHSRHSTEALLQRYLGYAKLTFPAARERFVWEDTKTTEDRKRQLASELMTALNHSVQSLYKH